MKPVRIMRKSQDPPYFVALMAWLLLFLCSTAEASEDSIPACETNFGQHGEVYFGLMATVASPMGFDSAQVDGAKFEIFNGIRHQSQIFVWPSPLRSQPMSIDAGKPPVMEFFESGKTVHRCRLSIRSYSPREIDLSQHQVGDCQFALVDGFAKLYAGHIQILELSQDLIEASVAPSSVMDFQSLGGRTFVAHGVSPGQAQFVWLTQGDEYANLRGLCAIRVFDPNEKTETDRQYTPEVCTDVNGQPVDLRVGDQAELPLMPYIKSVSTYDDQFLIPNTPLKITSDLPNRTWDKHTTFHVRAVEAGTMSLVVEGPKFREYRTCIIQIRE